MCVLAPLLGVQVLDRVQRVVTNTLVARFVAAVRFIVHVMVATKGVVRFRVGIMLVLGVTLVFRTGPGLGRLPSIFAMFIDLFQEVRDPWSLHPVCW